MLVTLEYLHVNIVSYIAKPKLQVIVHYGLYTVTEQKDSDVEPEQVPASFDIDA